MEKGPNSTKSRRRFIKGAAVTVAGASAAIAASNISRAQRDTQSVQQSVRQSELQSNMLRAQSADTRIGRGIASGLLDEVVAGAEDFEKHMNATAKIKIAPLEKQGDWEKSSLGLASAARSLKRAAEEAIKKGEVEVSAEIVDLHARQTALLAACHREFRQQVRAAVSP
jgi:hypothetical protein